jgi:hypothetical protein
MIPQMIHFLLYIDPGSGSILFQAILSVIATSLLFFNKLKSVSFGVWSAIKRVLGGHS